MFFSPARHGKYTWAVRILVSFVLTSTSGVSPGCAQPQAPESPAPSIPIFVGDFELFSVPTVTTPATAPATAIAFPLAPGAATPSKQKAPMPVASGQNPPRGVMLRGVFAEPDAKNRIRRSLWGGTSTNHRFFLYIGIFDLARPDQSLYQLAEEQPADSQYGPVITLNNYIPLGKYELDKNPSDEDVGKVCAEIAASLMALLAANADGFSE